MRKGDAEMKNLQNLNKMPFIFAENVIFFSFHYVFMLGHKMIKMKKKLIQATAKKIFSPFLSFNLGEEQRALSNSQRGFCSVCESLNGNQRCQFFLPFYSFGYERQKRLILYCVCAWQALRNHRKLSFSRVRERKKREIFRTLECLPECNRNNTYIC